MKLPLIMLSVVIALTACSSSSTGRTQVMLFSDSELDKMGAASFEDIKNKTPISTDKATNDFVQCVAKAITKNVPQSVHKGDWEVVVFDSAQVNAFALPGGKIGIYTGILTVTENQDQLAAIIGHEVGHVIEHHSNERLSANKLKNMGMAAATAAVGMSDIENKGLWMAGLGLGLQYGVIMPYSRAHESEADIVGQELMARSGFEPSASIKLWQNMAKLSAGSGQGSPAEFMSTHPSNQTRIKKLSQHLPNSMKLYQASNRPNCQKPKVIPLAKS
ncbi:peptidase [Colwellia sp. MT41]|uniref:Zn-dependent protease n=1 Tax=Colwellia marinimaniae TaxID=1513592 RepID=A0ABQ0MZN9_9GAMM|nr:MULTISPECIES: M48 family metallopeptidase [Colwellia]ALO33985.1 peptidase [Colwellia sp. MT41]GAW97836.1 Zn-dependent protease [Colwellia marinimaniae]